MPGPPRDPKLASPGDTPTGSGAHRVGEGGFLAHLPAASLVETVSGCGEVSATPSAGICVVCVTTGEETPPRLYSFSPHHTEEDEDEQTLGT